MTWIRRQIISNKPPKLWYKQHEYKNWSVIGASVIGASHDKSGVCRQDAAAFTLTDDNQALIAAVADGHGSKKSPYSDRGAKFATQEATAYLKSLYEDIKENDNIYLLNKEWFIKKELFVHSWQKRVDEDWQEKDIPDDIYLKYGTTILAGLFTDTYIFILQLGDGDILFIDEKEYIFNPLDKDPYCEDNITTSLCLPASWNHIRTKLIPLSSSSFKAAMFSTDGYSDSFSEEDGIKDDVKIYLNNFLEKNGETEKNLPQWLKNISKEGSGDDISTILIFNKNHKKIVKKSENEFIIDTIEERFKPFSDFVAGKFTAPFPILVQMGCNLVSEFENMHKSNKYFHNLSISDIYMDPNNGDIKITTDSTIIDHSFMPPEMIVDKIEVSKESDNFFISVLLFYLFYKSHPLEGKRFVNLEKMDNETRKILYGKNPIYIFDPYNETNTLVEGKQDIPLYFHKIYPKTFTRLFEQSFTKGLKCPDKRVSLRRWKTGLKALLKTYIICSYCAKQNFIFWNKKNYCHHCKAHLQTLLKLEIKSPNRKRIEQLTLTPGNFLYQDYFGINSSENLILMKVVRNPKNPNIWGLKNCGDKTINIFSKKGDRLDVYPEKSFSIKKDMSFKINQSLVTIVYKGDETCTSH